MGTWLGGPRGSFLVGLLYCAQMCSSKSSLEISSIPLVFFSRSPRAKQKGFLKKFALSFSFLFLRHWMRSAYQRLASHLLNSSHRAFRPSFSSALAFLQRLWSCHLLDTRSAMSFALLLFVAATAFFPVTSPNLLLHSSYTISPNRFSLVSTGPHKAFCNSSLRDSFVFRTVFYILLPFWRDMTLGMLGGASRCSTWGLFTSVLSSCSASTISGPMALWFSTWPWILLV